MSLFNFTCVFCICCPCCSFVTLCGRLLSRFLIWSMIVVNFFIPYVPASLIALVNDTRLLSAVVIEVKFWKEV